MAVAMVDEPESRWVDVNGVNLHYLDWGDPRHRR